MKIGIICVWYGDWPNWIDLWLKSCSYNPNIDFFIITNKQLMNTPENVVNVYMEFDEIRSRASDVLGMEIKLGNPYKLCDYKPIYGLIFQDVLKGYDYWGHCDLDVIWGNLMHFFNLYHLEQYEKFSDRGHLSLYKNNSEINNLFRENIGGVSYKKVYLAEDNCYFDEENGINKIFKLKKRQYYDKCLYADINLFYDDFRHAKHEGLHANYKKQIFYWSNGRIIQLFSHKGYVNEKEWMYLHFQKRNMPAHSFDADSCNRFIISRNGFIKHDGNITVKDMEAYNQRTGYRRNFYRREYIYCGKSELSGKELLRYFLIRGWSVICNSYIWKHTLGKVWIRIRG